jgi:hypothetical protein
VRSFVLQYPEVVSIERTRQTDHIGKYIVIEQHAAFSSIIALLNQVCGDIFTSIYQSQQEMLLYKSKYTQTPRLSASPLPGGSVATHSKKMQSKLHQRLATPKLVPTHATYANITRTKVIFNPTQPPKKTAHHIPTIPDDRRRLRRSSKPQFGRVNVQYYHKHP